MKYHVITVLFVLIITGTNVFSGCGNGGASKSNKPDWQQGGTLHQSAIEDWIDADDKDKIATCADLLENFDSTNSPDELRKNATKLKECIDTQTFHSIEVHSKKVHEVARPCMALLGFKYE